MRSHDASDHSLRPTWRDRMPLRLRRALLSRKALAIFLIALLGKLAFYGVLAWQLMVRR